MLSRNFIDVYNKVFYNKVNIFQNIKNQKL